VAVATRGFAWAMAAATFSDSAITSPRRAGAAPHPVDGSQSWRRGVTPDGVTFPWMCLFEHLG
jgi:hypothetical protein